MLPSVKDGSTVDRTAGNVPEEGVRSTGPSLHGTLKTDLSMGVCRAGPSAQEILDRTQMGRGMRLHKELRRASGISCVLLTEAAAEAEVVA